MLPIFNSSETEEDHKNLTSFAAIVSMAEVDGEVNDPEKKFLFGFADKLHIMENNFAEIVRGSKFQSKNSPKSTALA